MLKWPLIAAAIAVVLRVLLEQAGAPGVITNMVSVVMLYLVICPAYFGFRIARSGTERPYGKLLSTTALYAALARAMVIPTYWLAYIYQWQAPRFSAGQGGVVGPGITPLQAFVVTPLMAAAGWIVAALVIGGAIGSAIIWMKRKRLKVA